MPQGKDAWIVAGVGLCVLTVFACVMVVQRNFIFDDSFISYRYARHLAEGYGLVWNPGEPPIEGYTNFLLVIGLAPFIRMDFDPLLVTRIASVFSGLGLAVALGWIARVHYAMDRNVAWLAGLAFLPAARTFLLCTVGLETVPFALMLFAAFVCAIPMLEGQGERGVVGFGIFSFGAFLLRPEALLFAALMGVFAVLRYRHEPSALWPIGLRAAITLLCPVLLYLGWKQAYFGTVVPNPALIKMNVDGLIADHGLASVLEFLRIEILIVALAVLSFALRPALPTARAFAAAFSLLLVAFYLRVETLMDIHGRFLYPLAPFIFFLGLPVTGRLLQSLTRPNWPFLARAAAVALAFAVVFTVEPLRMARSTLGGLRGVDAHSDPGELMQREYRMAQSLRRFPDIENVEIAWGDAGVIPYFTRSRSLDYVGLNDAFIARHRDLEQLLDYFFGREPTLIVHTTRRDFSYRTKGGHGHFSSRLYEWVRDPRWDDYSYAGTVHTNGDKLLHLHIRRDYPQHDALLRHVRKEVIDQFYSPRPFALGSYEPSSQ